MAEELKRTPEPWNRFGNLICSSHGAGAVVGEARSQLPGYEGNITLMAAAPDLLEACQEFVSWDADAHSIELDAARLRYMVSAAIAKATGKEVACG